MLVTSSFSFGIATELLNTLGEVWISFALITFLESLFLFAVIGLLDLLALRRRQTALRRAIWSLLLVKLLIPTSLIGALGLDDALWSPLAKRVLSADQVASVDGWVFEQVDDSELVNEQPIDAPDLVIPFTHDSAVLNSPVTSDEFLENVHNDSLMTSGWMLLGSMFVVAVMLAGMIFRVIQTSRLIRMSATPSLELQTLLSDVQKSFNLNARRVHIRISSHVDSPAICGFWHPTILIPRSIVSVFRPEQLRLILVHELIHWRRGDLYWNAIQSLLQIVYFYNPIVWFTNSLLRRLREYGVDDETVLATQSRVEDYATLLVDVAALAKLNRSVPAMSLGIVMARSILTSRVQRMLSGRFPATTQLGWHGVLITVLVGGILIPLSGCHRMLGAASTSNMSVSGRFFDIDPNGPDARSIAVMQEKMDGVAARMLQREAVRDQGVAAAGKADELLMAAGVKIVAPGELIGVIVDAEMHPIAGAEVCPIDYSLEEGDVVTTGDFGLFKLTKLEPDDTPPLLITKAGYSPRIVIGHHPGQKDLLVILGKRTCIEGVVTDPEGKPVEGARVVASFTSYLEYAVGQRCSVNPFETTSDENGRYRLPVCSNKYDVQVLAPGRGAARRTGVVVEPNQTLALPLPLEKGIRFEALVIDSESGKPFEGFVLYTMNSPRMVARSDAQGRIVLDDLVPGLIEFACGAGEPRLHGNVEYWPPGPLGRWWSADAFHIQERRFISEEFTASHQRELWQRNNGALTFEISPEKHSVTIVVERGVIFTGVVTDPNGHPVAGAAVNCSHLGSSNRPVTDADGRFHAVVAASHNNKHSLFAHDGDMHEWRTWANGVSEPVQTSPGQIIENFHIKLTVPGIIRGRITSQGKPVADREVFVRCVDGRDSIFYEPRTTTAEDGTYELQFVRPGSQYVQVAPRYSVPDTDPKGFLRVNVKPGEIVENVNLDLKGN